MLIGEALGQDEHDKEEYFIGKVGQIMRKLLRENTIPWDSVHITNVVKVKPPSNKLERLSELNLSIEDFIPFLQEEIETVQPKCILAVGALAMRTVTELTKDDKITKQRGSVLACTLGSHRCPVMITLHPSYLVRGQMKLYPYVRHDIQEWARIGLNIHTPDVDFTEHLQPTFDQAMEFLETLNKNSTQTCIDIETVGASRIMCVGLTKSPDEAMCIPFRHQGMKNYWSEPEQLYLIRELKQIWQNPQIVKIGQNFHYDMHFLLPLLGFPSQPIADTMHMHNLLDPLAPHDLGFLISTYTDMNYHKDDFKDWASKKSPHDRTLWEYNIKDVIGTHRVWQSLVEELKSIDLYQFYCGYWQPFRRALFEMEWRGLRVDLDLLNSWASFIENEELPIALDILKRMTGRDINPNSSKQVGEYLSTHLQLPVPLTDKGNFRVNEDSLKDLLSRFPHTRHILQQILCCRTLKSKDLGTYLRPEKLSSDGRLRTSYGMTKTGRLSSRSNHKGEGDNQQNRPKPLREIVIPDEGHIFLSPDLSQAEALCMVYETQSTKLKQRMNNGEKIHSVVAEWIFGPNFDKSQYKLAKITVHGSNYKMGVHKFAKVTEKTVSEAKALRDQYYSVYPELPSYHRQIEEQVIANRQLRNPYGRRIVFTGQIDSQTLFSAYAFKPQSTVADTIDIGILGLWLIKPNDIYLLTQTHDEVLISGSKDRLEWFKPYVVAHLETLRETEINGDVMTIRVDLGDYKENWYGK